MTHFSYSEEGFLCAKKHAVTHPRLTALPYRHCIEDWVRLNFPDAEYTSSDQKFITSLELDFAGITVIQGAKGLGKSKAIAAGIRSVNADTTVLFVTFSRALAWASVGLLGDGGQLYSDISGCIVPSTHRRVCVVVNSAHRVEPGYDTVVIDELVSVITNVSGELLNNYARTAVLTSLVNIIRAAKRVVVADAMLDSACLRFLLMCRDDVTPLRVFDYTYRLHSHYAYVAHAYLETWERELDAALRSGKNVAVACMTVPMVVELRERYRDRYVTISYTAKDEDPDVLPRHMREGINKHWVNCQLLVYSPVITAGCSFEMEHFDVVFFYGMTGFASARSANQMISRIRDVSENTVHVFIKHKKGRAGAGGSGYDGDATMFLWDGGADASLVYDGAKSEEDKHMSRLHHLSRFEEREKCLAATAFPYTFWYFVVFSGAKITFQRANLLAEVPAALRSRGSAKDTPMPYVEDMPVKPDTAVHCWDTHVRIKTPSVLSGLLLQRAAMWHVEHATAMGVLDGMALIKRPACMRRASKRGSGTDLLRLGARNSRAGSWELLVAQQAIARRRGAHEVITHCDSAGFCRSDAIQCGVKILYNSISSHYPHGVQVLDAGDAATLESCMQTLTDACEELCEAELDAIWFLAGIDATLRTKAVPVPVAKLLLDPRPEDLSLVHAKTIAHATYMSVFNGKEADRYWAGLNVPLGTAVTADVLLVDVSTGVSHAYIFRASGCAENVYDFDVLKGLALCVCMPAGLKCVTVSFLYLQTLEVVELDVSRWFSARCLRNFLNTKGKLPVWDVMQAVVFVFFDAAGKAMTARFPGGVTRTFTACSDVFKHVSEFACSSGSFIKLVSWGFRDVYDDACAHRVFDLEYMLARRLNLTFEAGESGASTIQNARPLGEPCDRNGGMSGIDKLIMLYRSCMQKGALVYFDKASVPTAVDIYSINSVSFSLSGGAHFTETHTL